MCVAALMGPHAVSTMPEATANAFDDHGQVASTLAGDTAPDTAVSPIE